MVMNDEDTVILAMDHELYSYWISDGYMNKPNINVHIDELIEGTSSTRIKNFLKQRKIYHALFALPLAQTIDKERIGVNLRPLQWLSIVNFLTHRLNSCLFSVFDSMRDLMQAENWYGCEKPESTIELLEKIRCIFELGTRIASVPSRSQTSVYMRRSNASMNPLDMYFVKAHLIGAQENKTEKNARNKCVSKLIRGKSIRYTKLIIADKVFYNKEHFPLPLPIHPTLGYIMYFYERIYRDHDKFKDQEFFYPNSLKRHIKTPGLVPQGWKDMSKHLESFFKKELNYLPPSDDGRTVHTLRNTMISAYAYLQRYDFTKLNNYALLCRHQFKTANNDYNKNMKDGILDVLGETSEYNDYLCKLIGVPGEIKTRLDEDNTERNEQDVDETETPPCDYGESVKYLDKLYVQILASKNRV